MPQPDAFLRPLAWEPPRVPRVETTTSAAAPCSCSRRWCSGLGVSRMFCLPLLGAWLFLRANMGVAPTRQRSQIPSFMRASTRGCRPGLNPPRCRSMWSLWGCTASTAGGGSGEALGDAPPTLRWTAYSAKPRRRLAASLRARPWTSQMRVEAGCGSAGPDLGRGAGPCWSLVAAYWTAVHR